MVESIPTSLELNRRPARQPKRDPFLLFWETLRRPLPLVLVGVFLFVLVVVGLALPQLPGQYADDPAGATRWLLITRNEYGGLGTLLNGLGLFDTIHSPLIRLGLALVGLLLFVHLGEQLGDLLRSRRLPVLLGAAKESTGEPLPIPGSGEVFRSRSSLDAPFARMSGLVNARLGDRFDANPSVLVRRSQVTGRADADGADADGADADRADTPGESEMRWLVQGHTWAYYLRPLLLIGILIALAVLWGGINFGWEVAPAPLAPGNEFRFPQRDLRLGYAVLGEQGSQTAALQVELGDVTQLLAVGRTHRVALITARLNNASIRMQSDVPGIFLESDRPETFLLLGQSGTTDQMGFVFPAAGSEESLLIPDADVGLRLVRLAEEGEFLVEIVEGEGGGVERLSIRGDESLVIPLVRGSGAGGDATIRLRFLPGLTVQVRYLPGDWLLWGALFLILAGTVGYLRRPFFTLVQLGPWAGERSVLVVQSSSPEPLAALEQGIGI